MHKDQIEKAKALIPIIEYQLGKIKEELKCHEHFEVTIAQGYTQDRYRIYINNHDHFPTKAGITDKARDLRKLLMDLIKEVE